VKVNPDNGNPVQFVSVPEDGVPRTGVVRAGEVSERTPVEELNARFVFVFGPNSPVAAVKKARKQVVSVASFAARIVGSPVQFVNTPEVGVPKSGVVRVGLVANTSNPDPVSSEMTFFNSSDVVAAN
jgi:hypothetical protein